MTALVCVVLALALARELGPARTGRLLAAVREIR